MAIYNSSTGMVYVTGGTITGSTTGIHNNAAGKITITGGTITGTNTQGVRGGTGTVSISGSTTSISGKTCGVLVTTGTATITDGTIVASTGPGLYVGEGTLTLGTNDTTVTSSATAKPSTSSTSSYGVQVGSGTFNFYDGVAKGPTGKSITGTVAGKPTGYGVQKTVSGSIETAILDAAYTVKYYNGSTQIGSSDHVHGMESALTSFSTFNVTNTGYNFGGWTATSGSSTVDFGDEASITGTEASISSNASTPGGTVNLYIIWTQKATPTLRILNAAGTQVSSGTIVAGNSITLTVEYTGDGTVTAVSSGTTVATVSPATVTINSSTHKGTITVTGVAAGSKEITVSSSETSNYSSGTATYSVTVQAANYSITASGTTTYYNTLASAHDGAASSGNTIKLLNSCTDSLTVTITKDVTLDLQTYTLTRIATIVNEGTLTITGTGTISNAANHAISNQNSGYLIVDGATIISNTSAIDNSSINYVRIYGGTIRSLEYAAITNSGDIIYVQGGNIIGQGHGVECSTSGSSVIVTAGNISGNNTGIYNFSGTTWVKGGTVTGVSQAGISTSTGTVQVGTDDEIISKTSPSITGATYGVQVTNTSGVLYFYDGIIQGADGQSISASTINIPTGYGISRTTSGTTETAVLKLIPTLTISPTSGTVVEGNSMTFSVTYNGDGTVSTTQPSSSYLTATVGTFSNNQASINVATQRGLFADYQAYAMAFSGNPYEIVVSSSETSDYLSASATYSFTVGPANYQISAGSPIYHSNLASAVTAVNTNGTITALANVTDTSTVSISKTLSINTSSYTITRSSTITVTAGTTTLMGTGTLYNNTNDCITVSGSGTFATSGTPLIKGQRYGITGSTTGSVNLQGGYVYAATKGALCLNDNPNSVTVNNTNLYAYDGYCACIRLGSLGVTASQNGCSTPCTISGTSKIGNGGTYNSGDEYTSCINWRSSGKLTITGTGVNIMAGRYSGHTIYLHKKCTVEVSGTNTRIYQCRQDSAATELNPIGAGVDGCTVSLNSSGGRVWSAQPICISSSNHTMTLKIGKISLCRRGSGRTYG